jgi:hypothetical protein
MREATGGLDAYPMRSPLKKRHEIDRDWFRGLDVPLRLAVTAFGFFSRCLDTVRRTAGAAPRPAAHDPLSEQGRSGSPR